MDSERLTQIVRYALGVASQADMRSDRELGPIHLLKLAYLADLAHAKGSQGETFTGVPWRFFKLGPWDEEAHSVISTAAESSGAAKRTFDWGGDRDGIRWSVHDDHLAEQFLRVGDRLPSGVASAIQNAVRQFGNDTYRLLDHVYMTKPMLHAAPDERLDFSVLTAPEDISGDAEEPSESETTHVQISKSEAKRRYAAWIGRRDALRERVRAGGTRRRSLVPPPIAPTYDDVFAAGVAALDEMAGEPIPEARGTAKFSPEIWKSRGRRESDLS